MKTAQGLVDYAVAQLGRPYWWGTFGQVASSGLFAQKKAQYPAYYTAADFQTQYGQRVHDCVGLIKGYRWSDTPDSIPTYSVTQDVAVSGLYDQCPERGDIGAMPDTPGVCVFLSDMSHVGVYIGGGEVIEAMGHAYGVVKTKLQGRGWGRWGKPGWIDYSASSNVSRLDTLGQTGSTDTFRPRSLRYLRLGDVGEDVRAMQTLLMARGYDVGQDGADGVLGKNTQTALMAYQKDKGLLTDGEFGPDSFAALWSC